MKSMRSGSKLPSLSVMPEQLVAAALVSGEEAAWQQGDCEAAIDWLRHTTYPILGTELWLLKEGKICTFINTLSGRVVHCTSCEPLKDESWDDYTQRSARLAADSIAAFRWPEDSLETCPAYFNLTRADQRWFQLLNKFVGT
ncbi:MAG: hypothetical protein WAU92_19220 [Candidatus Sulfotelmatobacter sp.]